MAAEKAGHSGTSESGLPGALRVAAILIALLAASVYLPSALSNGFVDWDDPEYITENPYLSPPSMDFIKWAAGSFRNSNWHPLTWVSYSMDYALWGTNPRGYHAMNAALHGLNTLLVVVLFYRLTKNAFGTGASVFAAVAAGAVFGLHPLHVESVAWASERKDVLYSLFWLSSLHAYLGYATIGAGRRLSAYAACLFFFALSLLSKPMAVTLPAVLLVLDFYPLKRLRPFGAAIIEKIPFLVLSAVSSYITMKAHAARETVTWALPLGNKLWVAVRALGAYLHKMFLPLELSPFYPMPRQISPVSLEYMAPLAVVVLITALSLALIRRFPVLAAAWAYFLVTLAPTLGVVQVGEQAMADRYMYLPMLGPLALLVPLAAWAWTRRAFGTLRARGVLLAVMVSVAVLLSALTLRQAAVWQGPVTMWAAALRQNPDDPATNFYAAKAFINAGMVEKAEDCLIKSIRREPLMAVFRYYHALVLQKAGRSIEALGELDFGIKLNTALRESKNPNLEPYHKYHALRAGVYSSLGQYGKAASDYTDAIRLAKKRYNGAVPGYLFLRARAYALIGEDGKALADYTEAARLGQPNAIEYLSQKRLKKP